MRIQDDVAQSLPYPEFDPTKFKYIIVVRNLENFAGTDMQEHIKKSNPRLDINKPYVYYLRPPCDVRINANTENYRSVRTDFAEYADFIEIII